MRGCRHRSGAGVTGDNARGRAVGFPWLRAALMSAVCVLAIWGPE